MEDISFRIFETARQYLRLGTILPDGVKNVRILERQRRHLLIRRLIFYLPRDYYRSLEVAHLFGVIMEEGWHIVYLPWEELIINYTKIGGNLLLIVQSELTVNHIARVEVVELQAVRHLLRWFETM